MKTPQTSEVPSPMDNSPDDKIEICEDCGYVYRIFLLKDSDDYNDFGQRYCPFCGRLTSIW